MTGNQWLKSWASEMKDKTIRKKQRPQHTDNPMSSILSEGNPVPTKPVIAHDSLMQLQKLYGKPKDNPHEVQDNVGTLPGRTMSSHILLAQELQAKRQKDKITADLKDIELD